MKNSHEAFSGGALRTVYYGNGNQQVFWYGDTSYSRDFTFSGFGPSDHVRPQSGSYTIDEYRRLQGQRTIYGSTGSGYRDYMSGTFGPVVGWHVSPLDVSYNDPYNKALDELYDQIRGDTVSGGETLGESKETAKLLGGLMHPITTFGESVKTLAQGARATGKLAAGAYLSWAYGAKPLLDDIQSGISSAEEALTNELRSVRVRRSTLATKSTGTHDVVTTTVSARCEIECKYYITNPGAFALSKAGLTNPVLTAYQLTRLSFLVDWVYNIGNYMDRLENSLGFGLTFHSGYITSTKRSTTRRVVATESFASDGSGSRYNLAGSRVITTKNRSRLESFPAPRLPAITPPVKIGSGRLLNAAALLGTLL